MVNINISGLKNKINDFKVESNHSGLTFNVYSSFSFNGLRSTQMQTLSLFFGTTIAHEGLPLWFDL